VAEHGIVEVVVGLPRTLAGAEGPAAVAAREFAEGLVGVLGEGVPVVLSDERLTTVMASRQLRASGRSVRRARPVVDQAAAAAILQGFLDTRRR
jgi:putative Holliday junction resolvase